MGKKTAKKISIESHELGKLLFENSEEAILLMTLDGRIHHANQAAQKIFNRTEKELINGGSNIIADSSNSELDEVLKIVGKKSRFLGEMTFKKKDGKKLLGRVSITKFKYAAGYEMISMMIQDITSHKRIEEKLKRLQKLIINTFESMTDAFVSLDRNWRYTYMNKRAGEIFNRNPEKMIGKHIWTEFPEGIGQLFHLAYEKAVKEQKFIQLEEYYPPYDKWFENRIYPSKEGLSIFFSDITERKKSEEALLENKIRLEAAIKASNTGLWDWDLKTDKVFYSREWKEMIGYEDWEISDDLSEWESRVHPDDLKEVLLRIHLFIKNPWSNYEVEFRFRHKDGSYRWMLSKASLIHDEEGNPVRMLGSHLDITNRKKAEQEVLAERNFSNILLESLPGIFYFYDDKGKLLKCNKNFENVSGYSFQEIVEMNPLDFFMSDEREYMQKRISLVFENGESDAEASFVSKDGRLTPYYFTGKRIEKDGKPCLIGMGIDITELKKAEENLHILMNRLVEAEEMMRKTAAQQLHDQVGQNLTALTINLNYAVSHLSEDSKKKVENLLSNSLLILNETIERIRNIMVELRPSVLDDYGLSAALNWSINKFAERTKTAIVYKGKELSKRLPLNVEYALFNAVQEALHNVVKHAEAKNVLVTLEEIDNIVKLKVEDDGVGFDINKIKQYENQSGLGLVSMAERINFIGGKLEISSEPGKGTSVIINIKR